MKAKPSPYFSKSFEKGLKILSLFTPERTSLTLKEISDMIASNKSSAYRFVNTLVKLEYIYKNPQTKLLTLAPKSHLLGLNLSRSFNLLQIVKPLIDEAYDSYHVNIDSALLFGNTLLKLYQRFADDTLTYRSVQVDTAVHCHALGKAVLAYLPDKEAAEIIDRLYLVKKTENSLTTKKDLLADLKKTRERGYATNNEEYILGLIAIAAPFFTLETKRPVGAISFDFITAQQSLKQVEQQYPPILFRLTKNISRLV